MADLPRSAFAAAALKAVRPTYQPPAPDTTPGTRTSEYYQDNPNYPYPKGTFSAPPGGERALFHRPTGLPAYAVAASEIPRGEEGFYVEDPLRGEGWMMPNFPPEWRGQIGPDDEDEEASRTAGRPLSMFEVEQFLSGPKAQLPPGIVEQIRAWYQQYLESQQGRDLFGSGEIAPDPYAGRTGIERALPEGTEGTEESEED